MFDLAIDHGHLIVDTHGDQDEILKVKQLPGRTWNTVSGKWAIPILPGLSKEVERLYGSQVAAMVEVYEAGLLDAMQAPPITQADLFSVSAEDAISRAVTHHLYTVHHGDRDDYAKVHYPYRIGE